MKLPSFSFFSLAIVALVAAPLCARADAKPDFEDDAKPILSQQPGLIEFVESRFQVKDTGIAKYPGDDDHAPIPPYIFRARPKGSQGPYNVRLLIQPGAPGHILGIVQDSQLAPQQAPIPAKAPVSKPTTIVTKAAPAQSLNPPAITSDTPSGPIRDYNFVAPGATNAPATSNLAPPADPAPAPH